MSLAHFPRLDYSLSRDLLRMPAPPASAEPLLKSWDVRTERDVALGYTARVIAELKGRGLIPAGPETEGWADELRAQSLGASTDVLAGAKTIGELDDDSLRLLGSFAAAREQYCGYLVDLLNALRPFPYADWPRNP